MRGDTMTDRERINRYHRRRMAWIQEEPPKWRVIAWIRWRWQEPRY
jgi:hypothetical protein